MEEQQQQLQVLAAEVEQHNEFQKDLHNVVLAQMDQLWEQNKDELAEKSKSLASSLAGLVVRLE